MPIYQVTQGGTQSGPTVNITYTNLGTILEVTPRISANSNIFLKVVPEVSNIDGVDSQVLIGEVTTAHIFAGAQGPRWCFPMATPWCWAA